MKEGVSIRPLVTVREVVDEGTEMHHCVASYLDQIMAESGLHLPGDRPGEAG